MGVLRAVGQAQGKPRKTMGLTAGLLPVWMLRRVRGKKIIEVVCDVLGQLQVLPAEMLKAQTCGPLQTSYEKTSCRGVASGRPTRSR